MTPALAYRHALNRDDMLFIEQCFRALNPGVAFENRWHLHAIAEKLRQIDAGECRRLIVNVPPRSGKSIMTTIGYAAWRIGHDPRCRIICVSSDESLTRSLAASYIAIVRSDWFRAAFPRFRIRRGGDRATETITTERGYRYGVSIGGSVLGRGADLIIADDAMSPMAALSEAVRRRETNLWDTAFRSRLDNKSTGAIIVVCQRLHQDDLVGHVTKGEAGTSASENENWDALVIPAIAPEDATYRTGPHEDDVHRRRAGEVLLPEREPRHVLDEMRMAIGSMTFSAQYQQNPIPSEGNVLKSEWIRYFDTEPARFDHSVASWDTASTIIETSSYSVGMLWGAVGNDYYVLEIVRGRWETPALRRLILECQRRWAPDATLIEDTELGRSLQQDLRSTDQLRLLLRRPRYDKEARLLAQSARFEAGQVHVAQNAPWTADYVSELLAFPFGRSDDQVDATSQALDYLTVSAIRRAPLVRRNIPRREVERRAPEEQGPISAYEGRDDEEEEQPRRFRGSGSVPYGWPNE